MFFKFHTKQKEEKNEEDHFHRHGNSSIINMLNFLFKYGRNYKSTGTVHVCGFADKRIRES